MVDSASPYGVRKEELLFFFLRAILGAARAVPFKLQCANLVKSVDSDAVDVE